MHMLCKWAREHLLDQIDQEIALATVTSGDQRRYMLIFMMKIYLCPTEIYFPMAYQCYCLHEGSLQATCPHTPKKEKNINSKQNRL